MGRCTHSICPDKPSWPERETRALARSRNAYEAEERCTTPVQLLLLRRHLLLWRLFLRLVVLLLGLWVLLTTFLVGARRLLLWLITLLILLWIRWLLVRLLVLRWRLVRLHGCQEAGTH